ncbi:MAG: PhnD/SsuA/transferrin family substrate-binding protein [Lachnospiraceae bacterium]|nr:PhnD/SsuA/transferrin family substrate-binding protein [Robinsoniella sp.]MDY3765471.1 PhnD/SsuA/transferrin family substrate-binding protein [Lachnospiraceae bacterium]
MRQKKAMAAIAAAVMMTSVFSGNVGAAETKEIEELKIAFAPYDAAETILAATEPLEEMLKEKLLEKGYQVDEIEMTVGSSYEAVGEALSAGTADVGFISGGTYVLYDQECEVLLTALRAAYSKDSEDPRDWNDGVRGEYTDEMAKYYRSIILAGPSEKGKELAQKVNSGEELTWEDLNSATWAVMSASSASGYIYPSLWLSEHYGKGISDLDSVIQSDSYATSMARLASGQADILVSFGHVQYKFEEQWNSDFGQEGSIWEDTNVLGVTEGIYNDTISVSKASEIMTDDLKDAFAQAMIEIGQSEEGKEVIATFAHTGYELADDAEYDGEREAQKLLRQLQ